MNSSVERVECPIVQMRAINAVPVVYGVAAGGGGGVLG